MSITTHVHTRHARLGSVEADAVLAGHPPIGATVRIGAGKKVWTVAEYWNANRNLLATLEPVAGYTGTTVDADRLRSVDQ